MLHRLLVGLPWLCVWLTAWLLLETWFITLTQLEPLNSNESKTKKKDSFVQNDSGIWLEGKDISYTNFYIHFKNKIRGAWKKSKIITKK